QQCRYSDQGRLRVRHGRDDDGVVAWSAGGGVHVRMAADPAAADLAHASATTDRVLYRCAVRRHDVRPDEGDFAAARVDRDPGVFRLSTVNRDWRTDHRRRPPWLARV